MEAKTDGGQAFPRAIALGNYGTENGEPGMTLRDYFAAKAMAALLAHVPFGSDGLAAPEAIDPLIRHLTASAYAMADAMLKARDT